MYYRRKNVFGLFCILVIFFIIINSFFQILQHKFDNLIEKIDMEDEITEIDTISNYEEENNNQVQNNDMNIIGTIMIPKINLVASIKEGTQNEIIDNYVGHFEDTSINEGNIGLAAHNRGKNIKAYFANIKNLQINDIIIYQTNEVERTYLVKTIRIIKETDFTYLEPTRR